MDCLLNFSLKNFFVVFHLNTMKLGLVVVIYMYLLILHQYSLNSIEKQKSFFNDTVRPLRTGKFGMKTGDLNLLLVVYIIEPCICNIMHGVYILIHYKYIE